MKKTLTIEEITHALMFDHNANWSWNGAEALAEYFEEFEKANGEELELDIVAIRCEFTEYESAQEAAENYGWEPSEDIADDGQECDAEALQWLGCRTNVIEFQGGVIIQDF